MSKTAQKALEFARKKLGKGYSQDAGKRLGPDYYDCSGLVYMAYEAAGVKLVDKDSSAVVTTACYEVYAKDFNLLYPKRYEDIGKSLPSQKDTLENLGLQEGDIIFYNHKTTDRKNKITHVSMYNGSGKIIHARSPQYGVCTNDAFSYMNTGVCAVIRYKESNSGTDTPIASTMPMIKKSNRGEAVKTAQKKLMAIGYKLPKYGADGIFGSETDAAVRSFQKDKKLTVDGVVGPKTWTALGY